MDIPFEKTFFQNKDHQIFPEIWWSLVMLKVVLILPNSTKLHINFMHFRKNQVERTQKPL